MCISYCRTECLDFPTYDSYKHPRLPVSGLKQSTGDGSVHGPFVWNRAKRMRLKSVLNKACWVSWHREMYWFVCLKVTFICLFVFVGVGTHMPWQEYVWVARGQIMGFLPPRVPGIKPPPDELYCAKSFIISNICASLNVLSVGLSVCLYVYLSVCMWVQLPPEAPIWSLTTDITWTDWCGVELNSGSLPEQCC